MGVKRPGRGPAADLTVKRKGGKVHSRVVRKTTARERLLVIGPTFPGCDQSELAVMVGVSRQRVHQLLREEKRKVRISGNMNYQALASQLAAERDLKRASVAMADDPTIRTWHGLARAINRRPATLRSRSTQWYPERALAITLQLELRCDNRKQDRQRAGGTAGQPAQASAGIA